jgi:hypothetical protein
VLAVLLPVLAGGCDEIAARVDNALHGGTHIGVQRCIDRNRTETLSTEPVRRLCIAANERAIAEVPGVRVTFHGPTEPRTRLEKLFSEGVPAARFTVEVTNDAAAHVVTSYRLHVAYAREPAADDKVRAVAGQWLEPGEAMTLEIADVELALEAALPADVTEAEFRWWISDVRGIAIAVR